MDSYGPDEFGPEPLLELPALPIPSTHQHEAPSAAPTPTPAPSPSTAPIDTAPAPPHHHVPADQSWHIAAQLTAGMLANPAKLNTSVKDAVALFDACLDELRTYGRVAASAASNDDAAEQRRREQNAYFRQSTHPVPNVHPAPPPGQPLQPRPASEHQRPSDHAA